MVPAASPHQQITSLSLAFLYSAALRVAAELGVADRLEKGARSAAELAEALGVEAQPLYRVLRLLATVDVFVEDERGRFGLTPAANVLRSNVPGSLRDAVLMVSHETHWAPAGKLSVAVCTGETPFSHVFGMPFFDYFARDPALAPIFHRGMACFSDTENGAIVGSYDFSRHRRIVDVGGGHGGFLIEVLKAAPAARGVLLDAAHVVREARVAAAGLADRCDVVAGDFFKEVPGGDCILLKHIVHDWADDATISILRACRRALAEGGRILVVDAVIPPGNEPHPGKVLDVLMMAAQTGRERTEEDFRRLFAAADLRLERVVTTPTMASIVEASAA